MPVLVTRVISLVVIFGAKPLKQVRQQNKKNKIMRRDEIPFFQKGNELAALFHPSLIDAEEWRT